MDERVRAQKGECMDGGGMDRCGEWGMKEHRINVCVCVCVCVFRRDAEDKARLQRRAHVGWMMDAWMDGWMDAHMDGWMDGWMEGWMDGWISGLADSGESIRVHLKERTWAV